MSSIKLNYGNTTETCWSDTNKITTPSLILNDGGTLRYTPLFSGNAGSQVVNGSYKYTLGHLIVGDKRVSIARANNTYTNTINVEFYTNFTKKIDVLSWNKPYNIYLSTTRNYYVKIKSSGTNIVNGSVSSLKIENSQSNPNFDNYYLLYSETHGYQSQPSTFDISMVNWNPSIENKTISITINGVTLEQTPNWKESAQTITFTQTGNY